MKMNYKTIKYSIIAFSMATAVISCGDDFVDVESFDEDSENFFNSEEDYQNALIAAYDMLQSTYLNVMLGG